MPSTAITGTVGPGIDAAKAWANARPSLLAVFKHVRKRGQAPCPLLERHCWERGRVQRAISKRVARPARLLAGRDLDGITYRALRTLCT
eukprot:scaffold25623_cov101-Isochrysis_galbana.AAC.5